MERAHDLPRERLGLDLPAFQLEDHAELLQVLDHFILALRDVGLRRPFGGALLGHYPILKLRDGFHEYLLLVGLKVRTDPFRVNPFHVDILRHVLLQTLHDTPFLPLEATQPPPVGRVWLKLPGIELFQETPEEGCLGGVVLVQGLPVQRVVRNRTLNSIERLEPQHSRLVRHIDLRRLLHRF